MIVTIFDTETDGLYANSLVGPDQMPRVIELYAVQFEQFDTDPISFSEPISVVDQLFQIGRGVDDLSEITRQKKKASQVTGMTQEIMAGKPTWGQSCQAFVNMVEGSDLIVAHNLTYDLTVVGAEMKRFNLDPIKWPKKLCTVEATEYLCGYRLKLGDLYELVFKERFKDAHRAGPDVQALTKAYQKLVLDGMI